VRAYFHTYSLPVVTTNCSNNYDPYQFPEKLIPLVIIKALEDQPLPIYGDGKIFVIGCTWRITAGASMRFSNKAACLGGTYNIGGCNEWTNIYSVKRVCEYSWGLHNCRYAGQRGIAAFFLFVMILLLLSYKKTR